MKYSNELTTEICKYLVEGASQKDAAALAGISEDTFYDWKKKRSEFSERVKKSELECKQRNILIVQRAGAKNWTAAAWWLERKYQAEFALTHKHELSGKGPVQFIIKITDPKPAHES